MVKRQACFPGQGPGQVQVFQVQLKTQRPEPGLYTMFGLPPIQQPTHHQQLRHQKTSNHNCMTPNHS